MKHTLIKLKIFSTSAIPIGGKTLKSMMLTGVFWMILFCFSLNLSAQETWTGNTTPPNNDWTDNDNWLNPTAPSGAIGGVLTIQTIPGKMAPGTNIPANISATSLVLVTHFTIPSGTTVTISNSATSGVDIQQNATLTVDANAVLNVLNSQEHGVNMNDPVGNSTFINNGVSNINGTGLSATNSYHGINIARVGNSVTNNGAMDISNVDNTNPDPGDGINVQIGLFTNTNKLTIDTIGGNGIANSHLFINSGMITIDSTNANNNTGDFGHGIYNTAAASSFTNTSTGMIKIVDIPDGSNGIFHQNGNFKNEGSININDIMMSGLVSLDPFCNNGTLDIGNIPNDLIGITGISGDGIRVEDDVFTNKNDGIIKIGSGAGVGGSGYGVDGYGIYVTSGMVIDSNIVNINGVGKGGISVINGGDYTQQNTAVLTIQNTKHDGILISPAGGVNTFTNDNSTIKIITGIGNNGINNDGVFNVHSGGLIEIGVGGSPGAITGSGIRNRGTFTTDDKGTKIVLSNALFSITNTSGTITNDVDMDGDFVIIEANDGLNIAGGMFINHAILFTNAALNTSTGAAGKLVNRGIIIDKLGSLLDAFDDTPTRTVDPVVNTMNGILVEPYLALCRTATLNPYLITGLTNPSANIFVPSTTWKMNGTNAATLNILNDNELTLLTGVNVMDLTFDILRNDGLSCNVTGTASFNFGNTTSAPIVCNSNIQVSLASDCEAIITPFMVLEGNGSCTEGYTLVLLEGDRAGTDTVDATYINKTVTVKVTGPDGNSCWGAITVEDKLPPILTCRDTFVYCNPNVGPEKLGFPDAADACGGNITFTYLDSDSTLSTCGQNAADPDTMKIITRLFTAYDQYGNSDTCSQTILVLRPTIAQVQFPDSLTGSNALQCAKGTTVTADPDITGRPFIVIGNDTVLADATCKFGVTMSDQRSSLGCAGKERIIRTWTVMDWCHLTVAGGIRSYVQLIDIRDTIPPTFTAFPDTIEVVQEIDRTKITMLTNNGHKCMANILPPLLTNTADNCSGVSFKILGPTKTIFNNPNDSFINIPFGTHTLEYIIADSCGNEVRDTVTFILKDTEIPTILANNNVTIVLNNAVSTWVNASAFDAGSTDNCSLDSFLLRKSSTDTFALQVEFSCADLSLDSVQIMAVDTAGNFNMVMIAVQVSDPKNFCLVPDPSVGLANIAGSIRSETGELVEAVSISIGGSDMTAEVTGANGTFLFEDIPLEGDYMVTPDKDLNYTNGISTYDIVLLSKHVLGLKLLDSPYKLIAADINNSGSISAYDMVLLRQVILGIKEEFINNTSWRFIDAAYEFVNPENPLEEDFPEAYEIHNLSNDMTTLDFVAVKIGDLNGNAVANRLTSAESRNTNKFLNFTIDEQIKSAGETVTVDFKSSNFNSILGFQFTLDFDGNALGYENILIGKNAGFENFNLSMMHRGIITSSWSQSEPISFDKDEVIFSLVFKVKKDLQISEVIHIGSAITAAEAYDKDEEVINLSLDINDASNNIAGFKLYQNKPNPFTGETIIGFNLPIASVVSFTIFDMSGKTVKRIEGDYQEGYNQILIDGKSFNEYGMFYYRLESKNGIETKKMILLRQ